MTYTETDLVASIQRLEGDDLTVLTQDRWDRIDQFHAGGSEAVERLLTGLRPAPGTTVLDVGSGFGGPARQIARSTACTVVGVDITPAYVEAAQTLTHIAGLSEQVRFFCSDIAAFDDVEFDAAYTMHVQMNVADKKTFFSDIARRLRPGGRFATFEVCLSGAAQADQPDQPARPLPLPLPWSLDGTDSFLVTADQLRDTIEAGGFELVEWVDETDWILRWFDALGAETLAGGGSQAALPVLLDDGLTRVLNFAIALSTGDLTIRRGTFTRGVS